MPSARRYFPSLSALWERRTHRSPDRYKDATWSPANTITATRVFVGAGLMAVAATQESASLLVTALLFCWVGDVADGLVARGLRCETVLGAQLDSYADRVVAAGALLAAVAIEHGQTTTCVAAIVTWAQFGVVDQFMSAQFLRFGLWTSDELHLVDATLWRLNFSAGAKIASNVPVALTIAATRGTWISVLVASGLAALRICVFAARRCGTGARTAADAG